MSSKIDIDALSGILGSVSIACWVVVFTPQIIENFRRASADGLSLLFIVIWLVGDVFNVLGALFQGVLPTMIILAVYYTLADIILLAQCLWYRRRSSKTEVVKRRVQGGDDEEAVEDDGAATEESPLLVEDSTTDTDRRPRPSFSSVHSRLSELSAGVDATHLSPATPFLPAPQPTATPPAAETLKPRSSLSSFAFNATSLLLVCGVGVLGWWVSTRARLIRPSDPNVNKPQLSLAFLSAYPSSPPSRITATPPGQQQDTLHFDPWGQAFGYLCAALYLGSRVPQLLLNYRRKSTDGVSLLFFLFACVGNLTYVLSIFAHEPSCAKLEDVNGSSFTSAGAGGDCGLGEWGAEYGRYILVNTSWLIGSAGTLFLDLGVFLQFWLYKGNAPAQADVAVA